MKFQNSPESPSSPNESASASSTPAIDESSNEPSQNGDAPTESQSESDGTKTEGEVNNLILICIKPKLPKKQNF